MKPVNYHIIKFLRDNKYIFAQDEFDKQFSSHPDYPSLYAVTDTFKLMGVDNIAANVPKEELDNLPDTFMAVIEEGGQPKIGYVKKLNTDQIEFLFEKKKEKLNKEAFLNKWNGVIIAIEPNESEISETRLSNQNLFYALFIVAVVAALLYFLSVNHTFWGVSFLITNLTGLFISTLIVRESLGIYSEAVNKICNSGAKTSCNEVMSSKGANLTNFLSLSDLCIIYFSSLVLVSIFFPLGVNNIILFAMSGLSLFMSIYSIYYQAIIIKKWCILCLSIVCILIIQFLLLLFFRSNNFDLSIVLIIIFSFSIISLAWLWTKQHLSKLKELEVIEIDFLKLKRNKKIFKAVLESGGIVNENEIDQTAIIKMGDDKAIQKIYGILSPSCGHCITAFKSYVELVKDNSEKLQIYLIFNINPENDQNTYLKVAHTVLNILNQKGNAMALAALHEWFESEFDTENWFKKYTESVSEYSKDALTKQHEWCNKNEIRYTPATIFKSHIYPTDFQLSDLMFFIEED